MTITVSNSSFVCPVDIQTLSYMDIDQTRQRAITGTCTWMTATWLYYKVCHKANRNNERLNKLHYRHDTTIYKVGFPRWCTWEASSFLTYFTGSNSSCMQSGCLPEMIGDPGGLVHFSHAEEQYYASCVGPTMNCNANSYHNCACMLWTKLQNNTNRSCYAFSFADGSTFFFVRNGPVIRHGESVVAFSGGQCYLPCGQPL